MGVGVRVCVCVLQYHAGIVTAPPGPVNMVNYYPNQTVVNFTWSAPQYDSNDFGMLIVIFNYTGMPFIL